MTLDTPRLALAVALAALAGWVDAAGYLEMNHLFVSFMSGNTTKLGVGLSRGDWVMAGHAATLVLLFVFGAFAGTLVAGAAGDWHLPAILAIEAGLLAVSLVLPSSPGAFSPAIFPMAIAMGLQNAAMHRVGTLSIGLTYVTGTLIRLGRNLAEAVMGRSGRSAWNPYALLWLGLAVGATAGAASYGRFGLDALLAPAAAAFVLAIGGAFVAARRRRPHPASSK